MRRKIKLWFRKVFLGQHEMKDKYTAKQNFAKHEDIKDMLFHSIRLTKAMVDKTVYWTCHTKEDKNGMMLEEELSFDGKMPGDLKKHRLNHHRVLPAQLAYARVVELASNGPKKNADYLPTHA